MNRLAEIEQRLSVIRAEAAALRGEGARLLAADRAPGYEVIAWLVSHGAASARAVHGRLKHRDHPETRGCRPRRPHWCGWEVTGCESRAEAGAVFYGHNPRGN